MKKEFWSEGKVGGCIVTDSSEGLPEKNAYKYYYGGNFICESIWRKKDIALISAAPDMLEALQNLENDENQMPKHAWEMVKSAIKKATDIK